MHVLPEGTSGFRTIRISPELYDSLHHEAELRKETTADFCGKLLAQIMEDDLTDAVLDEEPTGKESQ
jgi:hypothetical protein